MLTKLKVRVVPLHKGGSTRTLSKRLKFAGMDISIETAKGETRRWYDPHGKESGSTKMKCDYGYIRRTEGTDGDHVDVYVGPHKDSDRVFIVNQMKKPDFNSFDEQKVMLGFKTAADAKAAYLAHYNDKRFFGSMLSVGMDWFKERVLAKQNHGEAITKSLSLVKADRPPKGWISVGKKGGYKSPNKVNGKHLYWYPGQPHPAGSSKPSKKGKKKQPKPSPTRDNPPGAKPGDPLPVFAESRAEPGSAVHKMENGHFKWMKARRYERSEDEHQMRRTRLVPAVDEQTKLDLVRDFRPLLVSEAKRAQRRFALKDRYSIGEDGKHENITATEMNRAALEGLLKAIDTYKGNGPFAQHAKVWVKQQCAAFAATQFRGVQLPERHARNLGRYMAARAKAANALGKLDPSPREVVPFFDLRKKHIHADLPAFGEEEESIRNAQIPDFEGYELGLGRKGTKRYAQVRSKGKTEKVAVKPMRDVAQQRSKLEWAEMYHGFLEGQKGIENPDEESILPGAGVGYGFSPEDQVVLRNQVQTALNAISSLGSDKIEHQLAGTKNPANFRVDDVGEILTQHLAHSASINELAKTIPVYKVNQDGTEKQVGTRNANELMKLFVQRGMEKLKDHTTGRAKKLVTRAAENINPTKQAPSGPSYVEILKEEASKFSQADVTRWQLRMARVHPKYAKQVARMSPEQVRMELAKKSRRVRAISAKMKKLATKTREVERISPHEGVMYFRDDDGLPQAVRVRMSYDRRFKLQKSLMDGLTDRMMWEVNAYPMLMDLLLGDDHVPSPNRLLTQRMAGFYG